MRFFALAHVNMSTAEHTSFYKKAKESLTIRKKKTKPKSKSVTERTEIMKREKKEKKSERKRKKREEYM